jgi:transposase
VRARLHGLWLWRTGRLLDVVAEVVGAHYRSMQRWIAWYHQDGLTAVRARRMGGVGQHAFLTADAQAEIGDVVANGRFRTAGEVRDWIAARYRVSYTVGGVCSLLARLRCGPKVPRPINPKTSPEQQEAWKGGLRDALAAAGVNVASSFGFADEMRIGLRGMLRRVWGRRGIKVRQCLQIAYRWRYLFLAVDSQAGRLSWCWLDTLTALDIQSVLRDLRPFGFATLVCDRAAVHREQSVRALGLPLVELPPASPELNPAERVFEELRRAVEGKVYATLADKVAAVAAF